MTTLIKTSKFKTLLNQLLDNVNLTLNSSDQSEWDEFEKRLKTKYPKDYDQYKPGTFSKSFLLDESNISSSNVSSHQNLKTLSTPTEYKPYTIFSHHNVSYEIVNETETQPVIKQSVFNTAFGLSNQELQVSIYDSQAPSDDDDGDAVEYYEEFDIDEYLTAPEEDGRVERSKTVRSESFDLLVKDEAFSSYPCYEPIFHDIDFFEHLEDYKNRQDCNDSGSEESSLSDLTKPEILHLCPKIWGSKLEERHVKYLITPIDKETKLKSRIPNAKSTKFYKPTRYLNKLSSSSTTRYKLKESKCLSVKLDYEKGLLTSLKKTIRKWINGVEEYRLPGRRLDRDEFVHDQDYNQYLAKYNALLNRRGIYDNEYGDL